jgi:hypothetical protein
MKQNLRMVKPFYSVTDFSKMFGMSRLGTRNMLYRLKLPYTYIGKRIIFYLSDIRDNNPALFASILEANHLNKLIAEQEDLSDGESNFQEQFSSYADSQDW